MPLDPTRRAALNFAKLTALAKTAGAEALTPLGFPGGAAASGDGTLWVLGDATGVATLGGALAVALKHDVPERLVVITDSAEDAGVVARRASYFASPERIDAAYADGTALSFCVPSPVATAGNGTQNEVGAVAVPDGVDVVVEHGVTRFEVKGLEIGRLEDGAVAVGVGKHDREAHRMAQSEATLADLAALVSGGRRADAPQSAMTALGRERWLRWVACRRPDLVGVGELRPVEPPLPRTDLREMAIAPAVGDGVLVAFSVGVDPDLVPSAADARAVHAPGAQLIIVVPETDAVPNSYRLAAALRQPARVHTVPASWPALGD